KTVQSPDDLSANDPSKTDSAKAMEASPARQPVIQFSQSICPLTGQPVQHDQQKFGADHGIGCCVVSLAVGQMEVLLPVVQGMASVLAVRVEHGRQFGQVDEVMLQALRPFPTQPPIQHAPFKSGMIG